VVVEVFVTKMIGKLAIFYPRLTLAQWTMTKEGRFGRLWLFDNTSSLGSEQAIAASLY